MGDVSDILCKPLPHDVRKIIKRNIGTMMRGLNFLYKKEDKHLLTALSRGWNYQSIEALVDVVTFYSTVIGPLKNVAVQRHAAAYRSYTYPSIQYGSMLHLDTDTEDEFYTLSNEFISIIESLGIDFWCLQKTNINDLIYYIAKGNDDA